MKKSDLKRRIVSIWRKVTLRRGIWSVLGWLLYPLSLIFGFIVFMRRFLYETSFLKKTTLPVTIVSVGNLEVGGVGKTPITIWLAQELFSRGYLVAVVARNLMSKRRENPVPADRIRSLSGRRASSGTLLSDEVMLLVRSLPNAKVYTGPNKTRAAIRAVTEISPDVVIVDDGFQHLSLDRDMDILIVDYDKPFGSGGVLPSGTLREFRSAVSHVDYFWANRISEGRTEKWLERQLADYNWRAPIITSRIVFGDLVFAGDETDSVSPENISVVAFCGIGKPWSFRKTLEEAGCRIFDFVEFPDHHSYSEEDIAFLEDLRSKTGAECLVTTSKDIVKLEDIAGKMYLYYLETTLEISEGVEKLIEEIESLISEKGRK